MGDLANRMKAIAPAAQEQGDTLLDVRSAYFIAHSQLRNQRASRALEALIWREGIGDGARTHVVWVREPEIESIH
jgi:general secretion pathway protein K